MDRDKPIRVAGVDGCRAGWVAALVSATAGKGTRTGYLAHLERLWVSSHFADALCKTQGCNLVCVDIPIGLSGGREPRSCDVDARRLLGPRASSVFTPPVRAALAWILHEFVWHCGCAEAFPLV
jgi:predicted RNase H-like nuclease